MSTYQLAVNERRLLAEFPAFFHSFPEMLTELCQNCWRSGGSRMAITVNHDTHELIVHDDGPGVTDPAALFTAGQSGWGESVVAPAGLGFFALLGMAEQVTITSHTEAGSWTATVTEASFEGEPIETEPADPAPTTGLSLHAVLKPSVAIPHNVGASDWSRYRYAPGFRQFYPITVTLTEIKGQDETARELPVPPIPGWSLTTPVGRIVGDVPRTSPNHTRHDIALHWIWEHRLLTHTESSRALLDAMDALPDGPFVVQGLLGADLVVWIDTATQAIRPKLPDRREVIEDIGYEETVQQLAEALVQAANVDAIRAQLAALDLPDTIERVTAVEPVLATVTLPPNFRWHPEHLLELAGYHRCRYTDFSRLAIYIDDGWTCAREEQSVWSKTALAVPDASVADALCQEGHWAYVDAQASPVVVEFQEYRGLDSGIFTLGFASRIVVTQRGTVLTTLNRWLNHESIDGGQHVRYPGATPPHTVPQGVWTIEPRALIVQWHHHGIPSEEMHTLLMAVYDADSALFWEFIRPGTEDEIDEGAILAKAIEAVAAVFAEDALYSEQRWNALCKISAQRRELQSQIRELGDQAKDLLKEYPELAAILRPSLDLAKQWEDAPWDTQGFYPDLAQHAS